MYPTAILSSRKESIEKGAQREGSSKVRRTFGVPEREGSSKVWRTFGDPEREGTHLYDKRSADLLNPFSCL